MTPGAGGEAATVQSVEGFGPCHPMALETDGQRWLAPPARSRIATAEAAPTAGSRATGTWVWALGGR
jgi:hypothetical protein